MFIRPGDAQGSNVPAVVQTKIIFGRSVDRMSTDPVPDWVLTRRRTIGEQIRAARAAAHLTQETLAERVGLDRKTVNRIEQGAYPTSLDRLLLIAAALDRPLADLVR